MILVSIDPGLRGCGCAAWRNGELISAGYVVPPQRSELLANAIEEMAGAVLGWTRRFCAGMDTRLVIEYPQTYGGRSSRGDANDLISIAMVVGAIGVHLGEPWRLVLPREWKGQIPKQTKHGTNPIELRCRAKLSAEELSRVELPTRKSLAHNTWDAVGIGLHALDR